MLGTLIDRAMDWTVVPGYSRIGYEVRQRIVPRGPLELTGRSVVVTGANSGIGEATSLGLARAGARVHMVARDPQKGEAALERVARLSGSDELELHRCDLSDLSSVRSFAAAFDATGEALHAIVNNAGVLPKERTQTGEGVELTFATNVLGPFLLTEALLPALRRNRSRGRVISMSSGGMYTAKLDIEDPQLERHEFNGNRFYAHTKRCEVVLAEVWGRQLAPDGIVSHSMHPGWVATPGIEASLPGFDKLMGPILRSPAEGADTAVWLAGAEPALERTGGFWCDRRERPKHRVPLTREAPGDGDRLFAYCQGLAGLTE